MNKGRFSRVGRSALIAGCLAMTAACSGGTNNNVAGGGGGGGATPTPTPTTSTCSLSQRQQWVLDQLDLWYLFPDLLDTNVSASGFNSVQSYIDALVAPARAQDKDRFFTFITSIQEETDLINNGSSAGFGIRLSYDSVNRRLFVLEAFENAPAFQQGLDRGTEILAIGTSSNTLETVDSLFRSGGSQAVANALGPTADGVTRVLRIDNGVTQEVTVTKAEYPLDPVSDRYGAQIIQDGSKKVGYINLRTFIVSSADQELRNAFAEFRRERVSEVVLDLRYNGGGLVSVAELLGDLLGNDQVGNVFSFTTFRPERSNNDEQADFRNQTQAIAATKIAFITGPGSASASELVTNAFIPYRGAADMAMIGSDTFGKPVGQIALDRDACDDRLRVVAFQTENADGQGEYFSGLASVVPTTCRAGDDFNFQMGDPQEASTKQALDWLSGRGSCNAISAAGQNAAGGAKELFEVPLEQRSAAQHRIPGLH